MYDVVVVGARCAGATTAMLLARAGLRVLLLDRAPFPSDTLSTHFIWHSGVALLARWGLLEQVRASGSPPIVRIRQDMEDVSLAGKLPAIPDADAAYAPRRHILDPILADAAVAAGAEFHDRCGATGLMFSGDRVVGVEYRRRDGGTARVPAKFVVGADGHRSAVAGWVGANTYHEHPSLSVAYWSYWGGIDTDLRLALRNRRMVAAVPTNAGATMVSAYFPQEEFARIRSDPDVYLAAIRATAPDLYEQLVGGERLERVVGVGRQPNFFRDATGPGWVLVGDAGHDKDSVPATGITDAFTQSALLADCIGDGRCVEDPDRLDAALRNFGQRRDDAMQPGYQDTLATAQLRMHPAQLEFARVVQRHEDLTDRFFALAVGVGSFAEFAEMVASRQDGE